MASFYLCPLSTILQVFQDSGAVLTNALLWTYAAGTSTPVATYTDSTGATPNGNPIQFNSAGRLPNVAIWQAAGVSIKVQISTNAGTSGSPVFGTQIGPTLDQLSGINDVSFTNTALANPATGFGADLVANAVRSYDLFSSARSANVPVFAAGQTLIVEFEGGTSVSDSLGGEFYWNVLSTATDDGINVIKPNAIGSGNPGRYLRRYPSIDWYIVKNTVTSIAANITVANDPDLTVTLPAGGTYVIKGMLNDGSGTSAGGLKGQINYSGTISTGSWGMNGVGTAVTPVSLTNINTTATLQTAQTAVGFMPIEATLLCTTGGTLSFQWAQNASNATASVLGIGSYLRITRISSATGGFTPVTTTLNTQGTFAITIPVGASTMTLEGWGTTGAGGSGSGSGCTAHGGGGGGSGGYGKTVLNVAAFNGQTITVVIGAAGIASSGNGGVTTISSGTFAIPTMTLNGGNGGVSGGLGTGGAGGTASGGNTTNTTGNAGTTGGLGNSGGAGGLGIAGTNGTGNPGGLGGNTAANAGATGQAGKVIAKFI
ncbi:MAG TPA: hypothetical protein VN879_15885 [Candidatus Acidoferrales bacterium]|nr:hypothetical protein [Candidatus Acidoferrales bacterium]